MITILHRYIIKTVLLSTLMVIAVVMALTFVMGLLGELKDIGMGDYGFAQAINHSLLRMPYTIYQFFPMLVLVGGMLGLGSLASNRELIVIRASGFSTYMIAKAVMMAGIILILIASFCGEGVAPHANFTAEKHKDSAQNSGQAVATASGVWLHEENNFLHIQRIMGLEHLEGVTRYEFDIKHQLLAAYYVKKADYNQGEWLLHDVVKTTFLGDHTMTQRQVTAKWDLPLKPKLLNVGIISPEEMSLHELSEYIQHLKVNRLQTGNFQLQFWKRLFQPFMTLIMLLLAIPFVFSAPRSVAMGWRILMGVIVGFLFYILNAMFGQFSIVFQISPLVAAILPVFLFGVGGIILLRRVS